MIPYAQRFVPQEDVGIFHKIRVIMDKLPDFDLGLDESGEQLEVSCHMLVRAFARIFPVAYKDGYYFQSYQHSWLVTRNGHIIDVYPIAVIGGPILIDGQTWTSPGRRLYKESYRKELDEQSQKDFSKNAVDKIIAVTQSILNELELKRELFA